jgi:hypothetical protein
MRLPRSRLDRDHFSKPGVKISHHRALRRKILTTVMGAPRILNAVRRSILVLVLAFLLLAESPAFAQTVRYELFPEPDVRQAATNRTASAYVVDKKVNQFWICAARYEFSRPDG